MMFNVYHMLNMFMISSSLFMIDLYRICILIIINYSFSTAHDYKKNVPLIVESPTYWMIYDLKKCLVDCSFSYVFDLLLCHILNSYCFVCGCRRSSMNSMDIMQIFR
jgi:hypothetical protein